MCLFLSPLSHLKYRIIGSRAAKPKIAKRDIIVYKGLSSILTSPFRKTLPWIIGIDYHTSMQDIADKKYGNYFQLNVNSGYFSFNNLCRCKKYFEDIFGLERIRFFKCVIKQGSRYYKGQHGEIASENLRLIEEVF